MAVGTDKRSSRSAHLLALERVAGAAPRRKLHDHRPRAVARIGDDEMEVLVVLELRLHEPRPDPIRPPLDTWAAGVDVGRGQPAELGDGGSARMEVDLAGGGIGERLDGPALDA